MRVLSRLVVGSLVLAMVPAAAAHADSHKTTAGRGTAAVELREAGHLARTGRMSAGHSVATTAVAPRSLPSVPPAATSGTFVPITPVRMLDTRPGTQTVDGFDAGIGPLSKGPQYVITIVGRGGIPQDAEAVVINVTATGATASTYLKVFPADPAPVTSTINVVPHQTVAVATTVALSPGDAFGNRPGQLLLQNNNGLVHVILDVTGYYLGDAPSSGGVFHPQTPVRVLDTRTAGHGAIPSHFFDSVGLTISGTTAVALNVTAVAGSSGGYLTVWPGSAATSPATSSVNFSPHQVIANMVVVGTTGSPPSFSVGNGAAGPVHVIVDVVGWYSTDDSLAAGGLRFKPVAPVRIVDSRVKQGLPGPIGSGAIGVVKTAPGVGDAGTTAIVANLTALDDASGTFVAAFPGPSWGGTSSLNLAAHQIASNMVMSGVVGATRTFDVLNHSGSVQVIVDMSGYFDAPPAATVTLTSDTATPAFDRPVTLTATVTATGGGAPAAGDISFFDVNVGQTVAVVPLNGSSASLTTSALLSGAHSVRAFYEPNGSLGTVSSAALGLTVGLPGKPVVSAHQQDSDHDGNAAGSTITSSLHKAWSVYLGVTGGRQVSSPVVADDRVFVLGDQLYALDLATGSVLWSQPSSATMVAYDGQHVFAVSKQTVGSFDAATGTPGWSMSLQGGFFDLWAPTAYDGVLYLSAAGHIWALAEFDGTVLWSSTLVDSNTGGIPDVDSSGVYVGGACDRANGFTLTGARRWDQPSCSSTGYSAVVNGGRAYAFAGGGGTQNPVFDLTTGATVGTWQGVADPAFDLTRRYVRGGDGTAGHISAFPIASGTASWTFTGGDGSVVSLPVVANGLVFVESNKGTLYVLNAATGASVFSGQAGSGSIDNGAMSDGTSPYNAMGLAVAGNTVLVPATDADGNIWGSLTAFTSS